MKRTTATQDLTSAAPKRQKTDTEMSTKIGKNKLSGQKVSLCEYEKMRMKILESNAEKMKAKGYGTLANKFLQEKYDKVARGVVDELTRDDMNFQYEPKVVSKASKVNDVQPTPSHQPPRVLNNMNSSSSKKEKQQFIQTLPMAEFLSSKSRERQPNNTKSQQNQPPLLVQEANSVMSIGPSQVQVQTSIQPPETQQKKPFAGPQEKSQQYCAPGSMSRYLNVRKSQGSKGQQCNDFNSHDRDANSSLADEYLRPQRQTNVSELNEIDVSEDATQNEVQVANAPETVQNQSNENSGTKVKKHRGRTILAQIHARTMEERPLVLFNNLNQPVGPNKEIVRDFSHLLGTLAKDSTFAPLNYVSWKYMPFKDKIWEYVQKKFILEKDAKKYVLQNVNEKWRLHKTRMKEKYYKEHETMEQRMARRPEDIPEDEFKDLMLFWESEKAKEISRKNKENRGKQYDMHTMGPKSFAMLRDEMKQNDPNKHDPSQADVYIESRKRNPRRTYLTTNEETSENIEKMKALITCEDEINQTDPYYDIITKKEHSGRLRMYGLGVTKSSLKTKDPKTPYKIPSVFLDHIKQQMEKTVAEQMEKSVAEQVEKAVAEQVEQKLSYMISKIREANQGRDFDIPDLTTIQEDGSSSHGNSIRDPVDESEGT